MDFIDADVKTSKIRKIKGFNYKTINSNIQALHMPQIKLFRMIRN